MRAILFAACAALVATQAVAAETEIPLSPAQTALFDTPHLQNVDQPETLTYTFDHTGPGAFADTATLDVREIFPDGARAVTALFLSGERRLPAPINEKFSGNPMLMLFLENDVRAMRKATNLPAVHFRDRIRNALVDHAEVAPHEVVWDGKTIPGTQITLRPMQGDDRVSKLPPFRDKVYRFVLSPDVPGGIAEIRSEQPGDADSGAPATTETLKLETVR